MLTHFVPSGLPLDALAEPDKYTDVAPPDELIMHVRQEDRWFPVFRRVAKENGGYLEEGITRESWIIGVGENSIQLFLTDDNNGGFDGRYLARGRGPFFANGWPDVDWKAKWINRKTREKKGNLIVAARPRRIIQAIRSMG